MNCVIFWGSNAFSIYSVNDYKNITCCSYGKCGNDLTVRNTTDADAFVSGTGRFMEIMNL